ncbi:hypothetical protein B0H12DRAFT_135941 [Mycena haematopus]|nr:hypothetical protein B0H12DRAFT_135941 [Mycena haematopus]
MAAGLKPLCGRRGHTLRFRPCPSVEPETWLAQIKKSKAMGAWSLGSTYKMKFQPKYKTSNLYLSLDPAVREDKTQDNTLCPCFERPAFAAANGPHKDVMIASITTTLCLLPNRLIPDAARLRARIVTPPTSVVMTFRDISTGLNIVLCRAPFTVHTRHNLDSSPKSPTK